MKRIACLVAMGVLFTSAASGGGSRPYLAMEDHACRSIGARLGDETISSATELLMTRVCWRRDKSTFDCRMRFIDGKKFADGKDTAPIVLRSSTAVEPPKMILGLAGADMILLDWSTGRYVRTTTELNADLDYLIQGECVGSVMTGAALERYLRESDRK